MESRKELRINKFYEIHGKDEFADCWDGEHCLAAIEENYKDVKNRVKGIYVDGDNWIIEMSDGIQHTHDDYCGITAFKGNHELYSQTYYGNTNPQWDDERDVADAVMGIVREIYMFEEVAQTNGSLTCGTTGQELFETEPYDQKPQEELNKMLKIVW